MVRETKIPCILLAGLGTLLATSSSWAADALIAIDPTQVYQEIDGFGASLTDSSAYLIYGSNVLTPAERQDVMEDLFDPDVGIGLSYLRQPMGTSDFRRLSDYTYDDRPAGQSDYNLVHFSIARDENYIIPALLEALAVNPDIKIMGSPWSAPAWMKDSGALGHGRLINSDAVYNAYGEYFVKYVQAYEARGIPIDAVTLQNEPHFEPWDYPGMRMEPPDQARLAEFVGLKFQSRGIDTKVIVWDHNWDEYDYPITVLDDASANLFADGSAFHCYAGDVSNQTLVNDAHPTKEIHFTECSGGGWAPDFGDNLLWDTSTLIIGAVRNWARTVVKWNLALDQNGGPKISGGCSNCRGVITIHSGSGAVTRNSEYYALGHASKFCRPGATRVESNDAPGDNIKNVAILNPDGSVVAIVLNQNWTGRSVEVVWKGQSFTHLVPGRSVTTFTWPDVFHATVAVWATTADQAKLLERQIDVSFSGGTPPPGDLDADGDVDLADYAIFSPCMSGPADAGIPSGCTQANFDSADLDDDDDVDMNDLGAFQHAFSG